MKLVMQAHIDQKLVTMIQVETPASSLGEYHLDHLCGEFIETILKYLEEEVYNGAGKSSPKANPMA
jgi:hypothetical protein